MSIKMRAKMRVMNVNRGVQIDVVTMNAVGPKGSYPPDGSDEDNTYAKFSPSGELKLSICNPALIGQIEPGQVFYVDFTPAD
ncbi:MAG: hypothetical protein ABJA10_07475 [Aestuariivirga sp.]